MNFKLLSPVVMAILLLAEGSLGQGNSTCPTCNESACCSTLCPNNYVCAVTEGTDPECMDPTSGIIVAAQVCKRPNCESCNSAQNFMR